MQSARNPPTDLAEATVHCHQPWPSQEGPVLVSNSLGLRQKDPHSSLFWQLANSHLLQRGQHWDGPHPHVFSLTRPRPVVLALDRGSQDPGAWINSAWASLRPPTLSSSCPHAHVSLSPLEANFSRTCHPGRGVSGTRTIYLQTGQLTFPDCVLRPQGWLESPTILLTHGEAWPSS